MVPLLLLPHDRWAAVRRPAVVAGSEGAPPAGGWPHLVRHIVGWEEPCRAPDQVPTDGCAAASPAGPPQMRPARQPTQLPPRDGQSVRHGLVAPRQLVVVGCASARPSGSCGPALARQERVALSDQCMADALAPTADCASAAESQRPLRQMHTAAAWPPSPPQSGWPTVHQRGEMRQPQLAQDREFQVAPQGYQLHLTRLHSHPST